jgi:hypothetical protein
VAEVERLMFGNLGWNGAHICRIGHLVPICRWARPDVAEVERLMSGNLGWNGATLRRKLMPLLMLWDAANPGPKVTIGYTWHAE